MSNLAALANAHSYSFLAFVSWNKPDLNETKVNSMFKIKQQNKRLHIHTSNMEIFKVTIG